MSDPDIAAVREALHTLYAYTSDEANPPGEGRSWSHQQGRAALARVEARLEAAEKALEPFARDAEAFDCCHPYGDGPVFERLTLRHRWYFTVTDIQCARRALAGKDV